MKESEVKLIQNYLKNRNLYSGNIDGKRGSKTDHAVSTALSMDVSKLPETWLTWSARRKAIAYLQLICHENEIDAGTIDGLYGPQTETASDSLKILTRTGLLPRGFGDITPIRENPHNFPIETYESLTEYYGKPCEAPIVKVRCPWLLRLDWELANTTQTISIHETLSESLSKVLETAYEIYGDDGIKKHGLDRYGGSFNCRKKRGSSSAWSTHAWGISIDWCPSKNKLKWDCDKSSLAHPELDPWWDVWEKEGWLSLGRSENRDWMHVQAAKR